MRFYHCMIASFGGLTTFDLNHGIFSIRLRCLPPKNKDPVLYKLDVLNAVQSLDDLRSPPCNRLERLSGDLKGFHSIRINTQWRIIFRWHATNAHDVKITDYH